MTSKQTRADGLGLKWVKKSLVPSYRHSHTPWFLSWRWPNFLTVKAHTTPPRRRRRHCRRRWRSLEVSRNGRAQREVPATWNEPENAVLREQKPFPGVEKELEGTVVGQIPVGHCLVSTVVSVNPKTIIRRQWSEISQLVVCKDVFCHFTALNKNTVPHLLGFLGHNGDLFCLSSGRTQLRITKSPYLRLKNVGNSFQSVFIDSYRNWNEPVTCAYRWVVNWKLILSRTARLCSETLYFLLVVLGP